MLLNHIGYEIYYGGGCPETRAVRRQSWPRGSAPGASVSGGGGLRAAIGHALIGLGQLLAADHPTQALTSSRH
jgi:hypothetical protein